MSHIVSRDVVDVVLRLCEDLATPRSLSVAILVRNSEWDQLALLRVDPRNYLSPSSYRRDAIATELLRKLECLPTSFDREAVAIENFWKAEVGCFKSNERLSPFLFSAYTDEDKGIQRVISRIRKKIGEILGPLPREIVGRFGPGATYRDRGRLTTVPDKMSSQPTLTERAIPWLVPWGGTAWARAHVSRKEDLTLVKGNRFTTVPKDATKFRGIAVEPSLNVFYQLGLGRAIRHRLRSAGLDLQRAQLLHRQIACEASIRGHLVTLDLSNASDSVCYNLVKLVTPPAWFELLSSLRSPFTLIQGREVRLEKFSSMGNGFTFELETLIFYGICAALIELNGEPALPGENLFVYGDDIIIPSQFSSDVIAALRFFGFETNPEKTFVSGPFRESCGGDFFDGVDVRPHYLKDEPHAPEEWIALANGLYRLGCPEVSGSLRYPYILRAWLRSLDCLPNRIRRIRGPQSLGDLVVNDCRESTWTTRWRSSIRYFRVYRPARFRRIGWGHFKPTVVLASALYGVGDGTQGVTPRDAVLGYKEGWVPFS